MLLLALFGFAVELLDVEPRRGSVIRLALFEQPRVPAAVVFGTWLMEAAGLLALYLLARGRCGTWWLDGLVAGWTAWIFRGPLLVITIVVAAKQPRDPWWTLAFGWWVLYSICGLSLALLERRQESHAEAPAEVPAVTGASGEDEPPAIEEPSTEAEKELATEDQPEDEDATATTEEDAGDAAPVADAPAEVDTLTEADASPAADTPPTADAAPETDETEAPEASDDDEIYRRAAEDR